MHLSIERICKNVIRIIDRVYSIVYKFKTWIQCWFNHSTKYVKQTQHAVQLLRCQ